jgi:CheY-like chemotaxis protein
MNAPRDWLGEELLTVLVVDDVENNLRLLSRLVTRLGHKALLARSGAEAIECFKQSEPDLILMDIRMPVMDGFRTTEQIRALQGSRWVPVIYVTAYDVEGGLVQAIEAGGDDYLTKPISAELLRAKLRAASRALGLQRENARQRAALERYYQAAEEEQKVASHLMQRLVQTDMLRDAAIEYRITPASHLSGDVIAAARTPGNVLHVLLADGTGHGLAASLGVMPVVQPFYAMTQKGFGLSTIVREVNRKVREWMPSGRFVAATFIAVDTRTGVLGVWNGGNPPVLLFDAQGMPVHRFLSRNLPLGILDDAALEDMIERAPLPPDAQLIACSDGVIEAQSPEGIDFGLDRLVAAASGARRGKRMTAVNDALERHLAGRSAHDDLSLVLVDCACRAGIAQDERRASGEVRGRRIPIWELRTELSCEDLRNTDVVARFCGTMERMGMRARHRADLFVILSELYANALEHGLLRLDRGIKSGENGADRYLEIKGKRLRMLTEGAICVELQVDGRNHKRALVRVSDSGDGFDWRDATRAVAHGADRRGLQRVLDLCTSVRFNEAGNDVVALYPL